MLGVLKTDKKDEEVIIRYHIPTCTEVVDGPEVCEGAIVIWGPKDKAVLRGELWRDSVAAREIVVEWFTATPPS